MRPELQHTIADRLRETMGFKVSQNGLHLRGGECPGCGKKSLFTWVESPAVLICERANKCGGEFSVKSLFPELFDDWGKRFPATPQNPHAAATAYLHDARGLDPEPMRGWYSQESYFDSRSNQGSATVRFPLSAPGAWWERLIDRPERFGDRKANFHGSYGGTWWCAPGVNLSQLAAGAELWITEGIFDAVALMQNGINAVAALSCNNYPAAALDTLAKSFDAAQMARPVLVWALDHDQAGRKFTKKHVERAEQAGWTCKAAQVPPSAVKRDWNDLHQREQLDAKHIDDYLYEGALLLAKTAADKALTQYNRSGNGSFAFEFDSQLWWFKFNLDKYQEAINALKDSSDLEGDELRDRALRQSGGVTRICNAYPTALYYQANRMTDESWYYFRVEFPTGQAPIKSTFTGAQVAAGAEFKKRLIAIAPGAVFRGTTGQLDTLMEQQLRAIKTVETVDFVGYSPEHGAWVFQDVCIANGRVHALNSEDFFEVGRTSIKTLQHSVTLSINTELRDHHGGWVDLLWSAFRAKGVVALAFWLGTLYAQQIRSEHKSYPFLEIVGLPGSGKTTLIEFLWKLLGRVDYEGFDPSKSTPAARSRNFAQVANLPVVLIEADRGEQSSRALTFDWDELKTAYNGRASRSTGVKNSGNDTKEPPFKGALVISQNAEVSASDAILERICHLYFDKSEHTVAGKAASDTLSRIDVAACSGFLVKATSSAEAVMATFAKRFTHHEADMAERLRIRNVRIIKNHAMLAALVDALAELLQLALPMVEAAQALIHTMATERELACQADHPLVAAFWEAFDYADGSGDPAMRLNHSRDNSLIAVSLPHIAQVCGEKRVPLPPLPDLKQVLRTSRHRKFDDVRAVSSAINKGFATKPSTVKCWVFKKETAA